MRDVTIRGTVLTGKQPVGGNVVQTDEDGNTVPRVVTNRTMLVNGWEVATR